MPIIEHRRYSRVKPESAWLLSHRRNVRSQDGEDGVIRAIFEVIQPKHRWCVEIGAWDGLNHSNSWHLIADQGWSAALIEGDSHRFRQLQHNHAPHAGRVFGINAFAGFEPGCTLDDLLKRTPLPVDFDLLVLDIDGNDWHMWKSLTVHRPTVVVVEFNPTIPNDVLFIQDLDPSVQQGCSLLALIELGKAKGYELVCATKWNGFFVRRDLFDRFGIADNSIDAMYDVAHETKIFQLFDGTIGVVGEKRLLWHGVDLTQEDFQVLPANLRRFPG
ncbi:hypothetical protein [Azospirillum himalayense]|uniref:hypothetical protein n=1 Tax=Azospirillum himalayense TaxID=654847 RepID=UPI00366B5F0E